MGTDILDLAAPVLTAAPPEPEPPNVSRKTSWTLAELLRADFPWQRWAFPGLEPGAWGRSLPGPGRQPATAGAPGAQDGRKRGGQYPL